MEQWEFAVEMEKLAVAFPRTDMTPEKWKILFQTFWEDLTGKTLAQLQAACRRYRQNPENRFFPSPGQLLAACKGQFETDDWPRLKYHVPQIDIPTPNHEEIARRLAFSAELFPRQDGIEARKRAILERNPLIPGTYSQDSGTYIEDFTPEQLERLNVEKLACLAKTLQCGRG